jgi:hypothetical protein
MCINIYHQGSLWLRWKMSSPCLFFVAWLNYVWRYIKTFPEIEQLFEQYLCSDIKVEHTLSCTKYPLFVVIITTYHYKELHTFCMDSVCHIKYTQHEVQQGKLGKSVFVFLSWVTYIFYICIKSSSHSTAIKNFNLLEVSTAIQIKD